MPKHYNVADSLAEMATRAPYQTAIVFPAGRDARGRAKNIQLNFQQLNALCDAYAHGLTDLGVQAGDRVLLLLHPGVEFIAVVFALVKMGAVPVMIDPGMGRRAFLQCVSDASPTVMIGLPIAHLLRRLVPKPFATIRNTVVTGRLRLLAEATLDDVYSPGRGPFTIAPTTSETEAAVAFTSGSTGIPKGVVYTQGMFQAQIDLLRNEIGIEPGEVDLALLYIFALFNPALGVTTIIPDMDPSKSAEINPAYVVESIQTHGVTNAFGSPTIWRRVVPYCIEHGLRLPSLKRVLMAGAPVPPELIAALQTHVLSKDAEVLTPYGATEAMPLTRFDGRDIVTETAARTSAGYGMCVGHPLPGVTVRVIEITDDPIPTWDEARVLPQGEIGEIVVRGPMVTRTYLNRPDQTARAKIVDQGNIWHRMSDLGYFDAEGRLWFCGRKAHRVGTTNGTYFPVMCETIFNRHPDVHRTAVVGVGPRGRQRPILVVEPERGRAPTSVRDHQRLVIELLALGAEYEHTRSIETVYIYSGTFPTDVRHNAKIQRERLAVWAASRERASGRTQAQATHEVSGGEATATPTPQHRHLRGFLRGLLVAIGLWMSLRLLRARRKDEAPK